MVTSAIRDNWREIVRFHFRSILTIDSGASHAEAVEAFSRQGANRSGPAPLIFHVAAPLGTATTFNSYLLRASQLSRTNGAEYLPTFSLVISMHSNSCFSVFAPVLPVLMKLSACFTPSGREHGHRLQNGVGQFAGLDRSNCIRRSVEATDHDVLEACRPSSNAAIAPNAISSLPLITPLMSGFACIIDCILL